MKSNSSAGYPFTDIHSLLKFTHGDKLNAPPPTMGLQVGKLLKDMVEGGRVTAMRHRTRKLKTCNSGGKRKLELTVFTKFEKA